MTLKQHPRSIDIYHPAGVVVWSAARGFSLSQIVSQVRHGAVIFRGRPIFAGLGSLRLLHAAEKIAVRVLQDDVVSAFWIAPWILLRSDRQ
jgi:hypothetical protein